MKNLLLLLPFLFLFFQKINGQTEPHLIKKIAQTYSDSLNQYVDSGEENYKYDARGNNVFYEKIDREIDGEITIWRGTKFEYDSQDRLVKQTVQKYNWEVELWLTLSWTEYVYNNDGCLKEWYFKQNLANREGLLRKIILLDDLCRATETHNFRVEDSDSLSMTSIIKVEYDDIEQSKLSSSYDSNGSTEPTSESFIVYNEQQEIIESRVSVDWGLGLEVYSNYLSTIDYTYDTQNERLEHKKNQKSRFTYLGNPQGELQSINIIESDYQYSCDGLLIQENKDYRYIHIQSDTNDFLSTRYHYIYEGEDECFDASTHQDVFIFPNPASEQIQIESTFLASGNTTVEVFDMNGKVLLKNTIPSREEKANLEIGHFPNGVYNIRLSNDEYFLSEKFVVVK